jgi:hypothetical protein
MLVSDRKRQVPSTPSAAASASATSFNVSAVKQALGDALRDLTDGGKFFLHFSIVSFFVFRFRNGGCQLRPAKTQLPDRYWNELSKIYD